MNQNRKINKQRVRRKRRVRKRLRGNAEQPRLSVCRSHRHISAQIINDLEGKTLISVSTNDKSLGKKVKYGGNKDAAATVGKTIAEQASQVGISTVCFDRGPYRYHGRVAALADAAREAGLKF